MGLLNNNYIYYNGEFITAEKYKNILKSKNLYSSVNDYPLEPSTRQKIVNQSSDIINIIQPFEIYDLRNTVYGRLITIPNTPLVDIGLKMLGRQLIFNTQSKLQKDILPDINLKNLFNEKDVIQFKKDFTITKPIGEEGWFNRFLNSVSNFYPNSLSPFGSYSKAGTFSNNDFNNELIRNTGNAQMDILSNTLGYNKYKTKNPNYNLLLTQIHNIEYFKIEELGDAANKANEMLINSQNEFIKSENILEYGNNFSFVEYFGKTNKKNIDEFDPELNWIKDDEDNINDNLVWGRDGTTENVENRINILRGVNRDEIAPSTNIDKFGIKTGLLNYTKNLLIANSGNKIDITRKVFKRGDSNKIAGLQGSPLWKAPDTAPQTNAGEPLRGTVGKRQHTVVDQYDNFAKTIRFDGNKIHNGNENSVIHNSVIPRIHPTFDGDEVNPKNLMFSIENLSVRAINNDNKYGIIDDGSEEGIIIPSSEVGPFMGRIMWFAPYGIEINESTNNTYETTVMMGRGEPIYNYQYSERSATIRFKLLIDHPPQVKGLKSKKEISEFFAFGITSKDDKIDIEKIEEEIKRIELELEELTPKPGAEPDLPPPPRDVLISFPHDYPKPGQETIVFDLMYRNHSYEIADDILSSDGTTFSLNEDIYCHDNEYFDGYGEEGYVGYVDPIIDTNFFQINPDLVSGDLSQAKCGDLNNPLNKILFEFFSDENCRNNYEIIVTTKASKTYRGLEDASEYNKKLSERRGEATKYFLEKRLEAIFEKPLNELGISITYLALGDEESTELDQVDDLVNDKNIKKDRSASFSFKRNGKTNSIIETELSDDEKERKRSLEEKLDKLKEDLSEAKSKKEETWFYNERDKSFDAILDNYYSIRRNKFYPAFFSQTPEDFHRRLTFLQQCMRQGRTLTRENIITDDAGIMRARNSVFGRQPVNILRIGDIFYTKFIIDTLTIDYEDAPWDMNPEGFGMQPMFADITLNIKLFGGQSLEGPISALQNAISYNHYANSTFTDKDVYYHATKASKNEKKYRDGVNEKMSSELRNRLITEDD